MKKLAILAALAVAAAAQAAPLYSADFSQIVVIDHTSNGNALESSPQAGANFIIGYPSNPASDTSLNFFQTDGDSLISSDFGGDHFMISDSIDVSGWDEVSVDFLADFVGTDSFNNSPTEYIQYFFTLDGGSQQQFYYFTGTPNASNLNASTLVDVTGISSMTIGLNANVNGGGDGFDLTSATVTGTIAVPEPTSPVLTVLAGLAIRRR